MVTIDLATELALTQMFGSLEAIAHYTADDIITVMDARCAGLNLQAQVTLYEYFYGPIVAVYDSAHNLYIAARLSVRIAELKRDAYLLDLSGGAQFWYRRALTYYDPRVHVHEVATCLLGLGACFEMSFDYKNAARFYELGIKLIDGKKETLVHARLTVLRGNLLAKQRHFDAAEPFLHRSLIEATNMGTIGGVNFVLQKLAAHALYSGALDKASRIFHLLPNVGKDSGDLQNVQQLVLGADLSMKLGEISESERRLKAATKIIVERGYVHQLVKVHHLEYQLKNPLAPKKIR
jgi:hypothetical protein